MRNRVALKAARTAAMMSKLVLVMFLVPTALVAAAHGASAATTSAAEDVAAENLSFGILGPVGITAVVLGFGGLIVGLLRHRRREAAAATVTLPVDASGTLPVLEATQPIEPTAGERVG